MAGYNRAQKQAAKAISDSFMGKKSSDSTEDKPKELEDKRSFAQRVTDALKSRKGK